MKLIIDDLEAQLDDINNGHINKKTKIDNNESIDSKNSDLIIHPNNIGLINHLKKENEKLRKLIISYELKYKKNIYNLKKSKDNKNNFKISKFNFKLIKKPKEKKDIIKNTSRPKDYKYNFSNKNIQSAKKFKNIAQIKKPEIKKIKDINLFDNDYSYMKKKEELYKKRNNTHLYNTNTLRERKSSISQRNRRLLNVSNNNAINSSTMRVKNVIINKSINNYILKPLQNFSSNRSHSKIIKKRNLNDSSFINNTYIKTVENRKNINTSIDRSSILKQINYKKLYTHYINKNKKKDNTKKIYYQKPIINKFTIYNNTINNNSNLKQKIQLSEKVVRKQLINRYNNNNNLPFRI